MNFIFNHALKINPACLRSSPCLVRDNSFLSSFILLNTSPQIRNIRTASKTREARPKNESKETEDLSARESEDAIQNEPPRKINKDDYKQFDGQRYQIYNSVFHMKSVEDYFHKLHLKKNHFAIWKENQRHSQLVDLSVAGQILLNENFFKDDCDNPLENDDKKKTVQYPFLVHTQYKKISDEQTSFKTYQKTNEEFQKSSPFIRPEEDALSAQEEFDMLLFQKARYGTPNPNIPSSDIPCSGCGAVLHCQDPGISGYMPSELFQGATKAELRNLICQRCHFLHKHNVALSVNVSAKDYLKLLEELKEKKALIILIVDLTDFPCSIWPGLLDTIGKNKPIFIVGNKVDLIPKDCRGYLSRVKQALQDSVKDCATDCHKNIKDTFLISAKTGYGIETLITKIQTFWGNQGDVYLVGCTNVGKSSLFNALIESDFCKSQAVDIVQRATVSHWPGTTLNLLKFPILRPTESRLYLRNQRLIKQNSLLKEEAELRKHKLQETKNPKYATLIGQVGFTFFNPDEAIPRGLTDPFQMEANSLPRIVNDRGKTFKPNSDEFFQGKWCYDTPGSVHSDQLINLLTLEELNLVLPKELIRPKTYAIKPGFTFFLAGLSRIDFIQGKETMRMTVFSAPDLPVTILPTKIADEFYKRYFGTPIFKVPYGNEDRLKDFPPLIGKELKIKGIDAEESCADVILSSAGWVSLTPRKDKECLLKAYTPNGKGCYVREPSILPFGVRLRGERRKFTPCYRNDKIVI